MEVFASPIPENKLDAASRPVKIMIDIYIYIFIRCISNTYCYYIDNSITERFIHPLEGKRKNSLFFVGNRMANVSAAYHTLLSTCRMNGLSALEYLKKFFREVVNGRRDYENLFPMTIGLSTNKY